MGKQNVQGKDLFTLNQGVDNTLGERIFERPNWTWYICKGYLPRTRGYVIYSPGAPRGGIG